MNDLMLYGLLFLIAFFLLIILVLDLRYMYYVRYAEHIIKTNSYTFYKAFSKISTKKKREAVYIVYAFCRYADDIIDEHHDEKGLQELKDNLEKFRQGHKIKHPIFRSLAYVKDTFYPKGYDFQPYFDMIEGQYMDTTIHTYQKLDDLLHYCYHVASSVGIMLIPILSGDSSKKLNDFAIHLGYAMQLTNILRDIGEDYKKGRIYIPTEILSKFNVSIEHEIQHGPTKAFKSMFDYVEHEARQYYQKALVNIHLFPKDVKKPLFYAAILYRAILDKCKALNYDVLSQKPFLSDLEKMEVIKKEGFLYAS